MALKNGKGNEELNNMSHEELQEWTTKIICEAQCENSMNQNLELTRLYSTDVHSIVAYFEQNAIDAAIACHGLFMDNARQEPSTINDEEQQPPVRRQRLSLPQQQSTFSNDLIRHIEPVHNKNSYAKSHNRSQDVHLFEAVILETIDRLGLRRTT
ncbi:uncharacterized protein [Drosophila pseudoobscura]|uniref:uncharacterized protein LOC6899761 n=1 Tax=Drosophila pseudoobscura pseudoobscura TaxID=46245 RepID=B5DSB1_DROPS|nr:uncharacterized protein LOC6899761 [Drosophila pseudoobscura]